MPVLRHVEGFLTRVQEFEDVGWGRGVDHGGGDELVHCLVVGRLGGVVDKASAADVDGAGQESHAERFLVRNGLESAN